MEENFLQKNSIKVVIISIVILVIGIFLWQYLNSYLKGSKVIVKPANLSLTPASSEINASSVTLSLTPASLAFTGQEVKEIQLVAQFQDGSASEKIDYLKLKVNFPKDSLELADYVDTTTSNLDHQIRVDGKIVSNSSGVIVIELGAISPGSGPATNSGPITIAKIKFRGKAPIQNGVITIDPSIEITNNLSTAITQIITNNATFSVNN